MFFVLTQRKAVQTNKCIIATRPCRNHRLYLKHKSAVTGNKESEEPNHRKKVQFWNREKKASKQDKERDSMQADILRLIGFGGLFSIVSEDVTPSTE